MKSINLTKYDESFLTEPEAYTGCQTSNKTSVMLQTQQSALLTEYFFTIKSLFYILINSNLILPF